MKAMTEADCGPGQEVCPACQGLGVTPKNRILGYFLIRCGGCNGTGLSRVGAVTWKPEHPWIDHAAQEWIDSHDQEGENP